MDETEVYKIMYRMKLRHNFLKEDDIYRSEIEPEISDYLRKKGFVDFVSDDEVIDASYIKELLYEYGLGWDDDSTLVHRMETYEKKIKKNKRKIDRLEKRLNKTYRNKEKERKHKQELKALKEEQTALDLVSKDIRNLKDAVLREDDHIIAELSSLEDKQKYGEKGTLDGVSFDKIYVVTGFVGGMGGGYLSLSEKGKKKIEKIHRELDKISKTKGHSKLSKKDKKRFEILQKAREEVEKEYVSTGYRERKPEPKSEKSRESKSETSSYSSYKPKKEKSFAEKLRDASVDPAILAAIILRKRKGK